MTKGTAPAWQAREIARAKILDSIKQTIVLLEDEAEGQRLDPYRLALRLIDRKLFIQRETFGTVDTATKIMSEMMNTYTYSCTSWNAGISMFYALANADVTIQNFQRAPEEGFSLWAKLFEWVAAEIVISHLSALEALESLNPQLILDAESAMTEVPVE